MRQICSGRSVLFVPDRDLDRYVRRCVTTVIRAVLFFSKSHPTPMDAIATSLLSPRGRCSMPSAGSTSATYSRLV